MKFSIIPTVLVLGTLFTSAISAPSAIEQHQVQKRQDDAAATSIVDSLNDAIASPVADIESILSGLSASSTEADNATAIAAIQADLASIVSSIDAATAASDALAPASKLARRQLGSLQTALTTLLGTIDTLAESLVGVLGLGTTLSLLNPLVSSLSGLLLSLEVVVNNLLALVQQIVDSLLNGLSAGLAGLVL